MTFLLNTNVKFKVINMEKHYISHLTLFHLTILSEPGKELVLKG